MMTLFRISCLRNLIILYFILLKINLNFILKLFLGKLTVFVCFKTKVMIIKAVFYNIGLR